VITLEQAVDAGCEYFVRKGTLDLEALAVSLAVSRATLYRVVSSRDRLLAAVLWRLAQDCLDRARARRSRDGIDGVLEVVRCFSRQVLASRALRRFIADEPPSASHVLFNPDGGVHGPAVAAAVRLFDEVGLRRTSVAGVRLAGDPRRVAYLLVRIVESVCFAEPGTRPDLDLAEETIRALLVRACVPRQSRPRRLMNTAMCLVWTSVPEALLVEGQLPTALAGV
jgi:hypothetical protein